MCALKRHEFIYFENCIANWHHNIGFRDLCCYFLPLLSFEEIRLTLVLIWRKRLSSSSKNMFIKVPEAYCVSLFLKHVEKNNCMRWQLVFSLSYNHYEISLYYTSLIQPDLRHARNSCKTCLQMDYELNSFNT